MYKKIRKFDSDVHIYEFDPKIERLGVDLGVSKKLEPLSQIGAPRDDEEIAARINATFFYGSQYEAIGTYMVDGVYSSQPHAKLIDIIFSKEHKLRIAKLNTGFDAAALKANSFWAISGSFALIIDGQPNNLNKDLHANFNWPEPRTVVGQKANGHILFVVIQGRSKTNKGMTGTQLTALMSYLDCETAANLDGGGSSEMIIGQTIISVSSDGAERAIGAALIAYKAKGEHMERVIFDIGHGSNSLGKGIGSFKEHTFNSDVVIEAKKLAELNGFEVVLPQQPNSKEVRLYPRIDYILEEHIQEPIPCLISFHANANDDTTQGGHGVFHWYNSTNGLKLAGIWNRIAKEELDIGTWGTGVWKSNPYDGWSNFAILRETPMPAILAEHFFFTNPKELAKCNTPEYITKCARVAVRTICEYYGKDFIDCVKWEPLDTALAKLKEVGITNSPAYWKEKAKEVKYLDQLLINMSRFV